MTLYKWVLVLGVIIIIALFTFTRTAAHAQTIAFAEAPTTTPEMMVRQFASSYGVPIAIAIAQCESHFNPNAHNPLSTAKGLFQFLDGTWKRYSLLHWGEIRDVLNPGDNAALAVWVIKTYGTDDWLSSKACWSAK